MPPAAYRTIACGAVPQPSAPRRSRVCTQSSSDCGRMKAPVRRTTALTNPRCSVSVSTSYPAWRNPAASAANVRFLAVTVHRTPECLRSSTHTRRCLDHTSTATRQVLAPARAVSDRQDQRVAGLRHGGAPDRGTSGVFRLGLTSPLSGGACVRDAPACEMLWRHVSPVDARQEARWPTRPTAHHPAE
jgi:hypothetical protein